MMQQEDHQQRLHQKETEAVRSLNSSQPTLIVVTGIMAAGKSTVARLLAQRFVQGVHIEADVLQRMIISGGVWVSQPGEPDGEAARQLRLRLKHLCLLGKSFVEAGFTVVLDYPGRSLASVARRITWLSLLSRGSYSACRCSYSATGHELLKRSTRVCLGSVS